MEKYELKIVMNGNTEDGITPENTMVYLNDTPVGCIQILNIGMTVNDGRVHVGFVLPNLKSPNVDVKYYNRAGLNFSNEVLSSATALAKCPNVSVSLMDLEKIPSISVEHDTALIKEIGTDGFIEHVPLNQNQS